MREPAVSSVPASSIGSAALGVAAHAVTCSVLAAAGTAHVRTPMPRLLLVPVVAIVAVLVVRPGPAGATLPLAVAVAWLAAGLAHHHLVGITPQWGSAPVRGLGHLAWDVAFHAPAILLAVGAASLPRRSGVA